MEWNIVKIDHIQICIPTGKEEEAKKFYLELLGFKEIEKPDSLKENGGFWCKSGTVSLHIGTENMKNIKSKRHPAFKVNHLHAARAFLESYGILIQDEKPIPFVNRFSFFDPFGNRIELLEKE
ncbi:VOC family protein [Metabacillus arenae]|uniref:VOC family protein n=1 Tax=Metabacillus arenae TaxID=2771434 RepID=A0A926RXS5_9BACI|nr:VOC family protein [Metabacillus arenae]MBD1381286.1 VOC family protein [Metabacillus arenae]